MEIKPGSIVIIGCGPGSPDYLVPAARAGLSSAEVLVGAARLLALFPETRALPIHVGADIPRVLDAMALHVGVKRVAVLVTGDPGMSRLARPDVPRYGRSACRIIPGVSSVQVAFARLALDWQDARIISVHNEVAAPDFNTLRGETKIAALTAGEKSRAWLRALANALRESHAVFVCSNLTLPDEKVEACPVMALETVPLPSLTVVLFIHKKELL